MSQNGPAVLYRQFMHSPVTWLHIPGFDASTLLLQLQSLHSLPGSNGLPK
jgi:hypothetical protein